MDRFAYLNNIMPLCWEPGHMGTFLIRVLSHRYIKDSNKIVHRYFTHLPSYEWIVEDRIGCFYGYDTGKAENRLKVLLDTLRKICPDPVDFEKALLHILLQLTHDYYTEESYKNKCEDVRYWNYDLTEEQIIKLYENNYNNSGTVLPIIKAHYTNYMHSPLAKIPFNKIIHAGYFGEKSWIPEVLLFYKRFDHYVKTNNMIRLERTFKEGRRHNAERLRNIIGGTSTLQIYFETIIANWESMAEVKNNLVDIDMYDLIFNKNIDQLKLVDSFYENYTDDSLIELLDQVEEHTRLILKKYDLDPDLNLDIRTKDPNIQLLRTPALVEAVDLIKQLSDSYY